ncbi:TlyA family RNA methyltransferase [Candidatus Babeliales bacterium]|nr:TlyA family RNA methyltransferase [Candidatus Babeliales bacterium]
MAIQKKRLDLLVLEQHPEWSRTQIQSWILQGKVHVNNEKISKAGILVALDSTIECNIEIPKYVSRGGLKLEKALEDFQIDVSGLTAIDGGISTGGFTDCLLQNGAAKVYGIDVGHGQVHEKLRQDSRVIIREKTNLRTLTWRAALVDIVVLDLSFISLLKVLPAVLASLKPNGIIVALIKPQFEAERHQIGAKGLVKDPLVHKAVQEKIVAGMAELGSECQGIIESPIRGNNSGNKEFLGYFIKKQTS